MSERIINIEWFKDIIEGLENCRMVRLATQEDNTLDLFIINENHNLDGIRIFFKQLKEMLELPQNALINLVETLNDAQDIRVKWSYDA